MRKVAITYGEMMKELDILCEECPFFMRSVIGKSLVGREIPLISVGQGKKAVLFVGTHHGMEWITTALLLDFLRDVGKEVGRGGDLSVVLENRTLCVVPMLNPDGVELQINGKDELNPLTERLHAMSGGDYSRWQANGRGVDLNHNYDAGFFEYKEYEREHGIVPGSTLYSGEHPESEPETSALCSFIRARGIDLLIALHTQGEEIYYDFGGVVPDGGRVIAKRLSALTGYTLSEPTGSAAYGGLKDWFIKEYGLPAFTLECGKGVNPLPIGDTDIIYKGLREALFSCLTVV
ncbi:MAG: M14 family metallocarboxypeptidase [Clostridia bacterium]|nr:M14 family metallocarboxypeptidase [Clostridia bacterium]